MTSEQVAYWRQRAEEMANGPYDYGGGKELLRLLDEREALLGAARHVVDAASSGRGPMTAGELRLQAVVAKAEAP